MRMLRIPLLAAALVLALSRPAAADDTSQFKALVDDMYAAWNTWTTEAPAKYFAKDADLVFFDIAPLKYDGWSGYAKGVEENFFSKASSGKLTPHDDLRVVRRGRVAWGTLTFRIDVTFKNGQEWSAEGRDTLIWEKRGKDWLCVHEHVSVPLPE